MSFSRWYPTSNFFYDPAVAPTKPIANLATKDEALFRQIPKGRYDTTYRREYLNFINSDPERTSNNILEQYRIGGQQQQQQQQQQSPPPPQQHAAMNPYQVLPPINNDGTSPANQMYNNNNQHSAMGHNNNNQYQNFQPPAPTPTQPDINKDTYLPVEPTYLTPLEEQTLINDVNEEMGPYSSEQLKNFYTELTNYDPNLTGYVNHVYMTLGANKHNLRLSESSLRLIASRYVSATKPRGSVNYEEFVKFIAKCIGEKKRMMEQRYQQQQPPPPQSPQYYLPPSQQQSASPRRNVTDAEGYDPDEQAILRLMHENMREWDQVNTIDTNNLRREFSRIDPQNRQIFSRREFEDILYKNRIPIQSSLIFQILEKYCKVASGLYRWPAFVDFLDRVTEIKYPNRKQNPDYVVREGEKVRPPLAAHYNYRQAQIDNLNQQPTEQDRLHQINSEIPNVRYMRQMDSDNREYSSPRGPQGEYEQDPWFTRFMRLANVLYNHRGNGTRSEFSLQKDHARQLIQQHNRIYQLNVPESEIDNAINTSTFNGNCVIDKVLKILSNTH